MSPGIILRLGLFEPDGLRQPLPLHDLALRHVHRLAGRQHLQRALPQWSESTREFQSGGGPVGSDEGSVGERDLRLFGFGAGDGAVPSAGVEILCQ